MGARNLINKQIDLSSLVLICFLNDYFGELVGKKEATKPFQGTFFLYFLPSTISDKLFLPKEWLCIVYDTLISLVVFISEEN